MTQSPVLVRIQFIDSLSINLSDLLEINLHTVIGPEMSGALWEVAFSKGRNYVGWGFSEVSHYGTSHFQTLAVGLMRIPLINCKASNWNARGKISEGGMQNVHVKSFSVRVKWYSSIVFCLRHLQSWWSLIGSTVDTVTHSPSHLIERPRNNVSCSPCTIFKMLQKLELHEAHFYSHCSDDGELRSFYLLSSVLVHFVVWCTS